MAGRLIKRRARLAVLALSALALAFPASALALKPVPSQSASLSFDGCDARVVADWANQPGRYQTYQVRLMNDENGTLYHAADGRARSGHVDVTLRLIAGSEKNFRVVLWFFNREGAVVNGALSAWVPATCQ
jgi:hypothetical protein